MAAVFDRRRPDLESGVFETLLVVAGRPVELDAHLDRLGASLWALFRGMPPGNLGEEISERAGGIRAGSLRVTAAPEADGTLRAEIAIRQLSPRGDFPVIYTGKSPHPTIDLRTLVLDGGLGAHKWADRSLLDEAQGGLPAETLPLVVDRDGAALEVSRANLFAARRGALFTPPLDGRILPGVTRARVLAIAAAIGVETHEAELSRDDLLSADEVFLTGSVRGIERVGTLDGTELVATGDVTTRLAAELRRTWIDGPFG